MAATPVMMMPAAQSDNSMKIILIVALVGGAAAVGAYFWFNRESSSSSTTTKSSSTPPPPRKPSGPPEVYYIKPEAGYGPYASFGEIMKKLGCKEATKSQLSLAFKAGANWCSYGFVNESGVHNCYLLNAGGPKGCIPNHPVVGLVGGASDPYTKSDTCGMHVYGPKPPESENEIDGFVIYPFNSNQWSQHDSSSSA